MHIKDLTKCVEITAGDNSLLKELLHPYKENLKINYSLAYAKVSPGKTTLPHKLKCAEVYYILEGHGKMHIGEETQNVSSGCAIYIPPNTIQKINNIGVSDLVFICIVDPPWRPEHEEIIQ